MASIKLHITNSLISTKPNMGSWNDASVSIERQGNGLGNVDCPKEAKHLDINNSDFSSLESYHKLRFHYEQLKLQ